MKRSEKLFFSIIQEQALAIGIGVISAEEIDEINVYEATKKGDDRGDWKFIYLTAAFAHRCNEAAASDCANVHYQR
ncbi:hypothetical protein GCM10020331_047810 [Ectobacillus funiculus]